MYRLLIVDDEPYIVDWISEIIETQAGIELETYRAYSVPEALNWLNRARIDIMVTDICMPEISGITLAQKVRQNWPACKIIMLTAHAEFDYAYEAIQSNVTGYVLKTEDDDRILETVKKAVRELDKELKDLQLLSEAQDRLYDSMRSVQKELVLGILNGGNCKKEDIIRQLSRVNLKMDVEAPFLLITGKIDGIPESANIVDRHDYNRTVRGIMAHYLDRYFNCFQMEYCDERIILLLQPKVDERNEKQKEALSYEYYITYAKGTLEFVQQSCTGNMNLVLSFVISSTFLQFDQLHEKYYHMLRMLVHCGADEKGAIITDRFHEGQVNANPAGLDAELKKSRMKLNSLNLLATYLEKGDRDKFFEGLGDICKDLRKVKDQNDHITREIYYSVALMLLSYINGREISERTAFKIDVDGLFKIDSRNSWNESIDYLYRLANEFMDLRVQDMGNRSLNLVQFINEYIRNNITGDVSLIKLSEVTGYNPTYLSRLYSKTAHETLNDYTGRIRFDKAKNLLEGNRSSMNEIAKEIGLRSRTYFNRFIKKITGMSPQEYRDYLHKNKERRCVNG